jgi:hypothetical protein
MSKVIKDDNAYNNTNSFVRNENEHFLNVKMTFSRKPHTHTQQNDDATNTHINRKANNNNHKKNLETNSFKFQTRIL